MDRADACVVRGPVVDCPPAHVECVRNGRVRNGRVNGKKRRSLNCYIRDGLRGIKAAADRTVAERNEVVHTLRKSTSEHRKSGIGEPGPKQRAYIGTRVAVCCAAENRIAAGCRECPHMDGINTSAAGGSFVDRPATKNERLG